MTANILQVAQPTIASKLPPNLTPAQQQQVQAQKQVYDAHVAVSRIAASQVAPPSTQKATASASSQSDLTHRSSARNESTTRLQSGGNSSSGRVEPPLASDNLSTPGATANPSEQAGPATDSYYGQADYQAQTEYSNSMKSYSKFLPGWNKYRHELLIDSDSDAYRESSADITDNNQLSPIPSTPHVIVKTEPLSPT